VLVLDGAFVQEGGRLSRNCICAADTCQPKLQILEDEGRRREYDLLTERRTANREPRTGLSQHEMGRSVAPDLQKNRASVTVSLVEISIKDLHEKTGELVRQAALARNPVEVTDRGKVIAVLGSPKLIKPKAIKRGLPGEYLAFVKKLPRTDVMRYLDELRER
jgi:hypothetical protein